MTDQPTNEVSTESPEAAVSEVVPRWLLFLPIIASVAFVILTTHAAILETPTVDEFAHVPAGCVYWEHGRYDLYAQNPPLLKMIMAIPLIFSDAKVPDVDLPQHAWRNIQYGYYFQEANRDSYFQLMRGARFVVIGFGLLAGWLLFAWAKQLYDYQAASVITTVYFLSPNILAHSHLATIDIGCMATIFLVAFVSTWTYRQPSWFRVGVLGAVWGIALLVKFTAVILMPALALLMVLHRRRNWKLAVAEFALVIAAATLVVNLGMGFDGSFRSLGQFQFFSSFAKGLQNLLPSALPVPLPEQYVLGFDQQKVATELGETGSYLYGQWSESGWWYYFAIAFLVKVPLPLLAMIVLGIRSFCRASIERQERYALLIPFATVFFFMTLFNSLNIGIRYLLPIFPFVFLIVASLWQRGGHALQKLGGVAVLVYYVAIVGMTHPGYLSFFNSIGGGSARGHEVLTDSNIDWGQDLYRLRTTLDEMNVDGKIGLLYFGHVDPKLYGIEYELISDKPQPGIMAISIHYLVGGSYLATDLNGDVVNIDRNRADWLRREIPVKRIGSIWIFDTRYLAEESEP